MCDNNRNKASGVIISEITDIMEKYLAEKMSDEHCDNKSEILRSGIKEYAQLKFHKVIIDGTIADEIDRQVETVMTVLNEAIDGKLDDVAGEYRKYKSGNMSKQELIERIKMQIDTIVGIKLFMFRLGKFDV